MAARINSLTNIGCDETANAPAASRNSFSLMGRTPPNRNQQSNRDR
jgi:hypothetical protein